jgi:hypothetical protein
MEKLQLRKKTLTLSACEKASTKLLMEKMGVSKDEVAEITSIYGVDASRLLEVMQLC